MFISELKNRELTDKIIDSVLFEGLEGTEEAADCIIVLGSTKASKYKVPIAVSAYKENRVPKLLLSGGKIKDFNEGRMSEADHMCRTAMRPSLGARKSSGR